MADRKPLILTMDKRLLLFVTGLAIYMPEYILLSLSFDHGSRLRGALFAVGLHVLRVALYQAAQSRTIYDRLAGGPRDREFFQVRTMGFLLVSGAVGTAILCLFLGWIGTLPPVIAAMLVIFDTVGLFGALVAERLHPRGG